MVIPKISFPLKCYVGVRHMRHHNCIIATHLMTFFPSSTLFTCTIKSKSMIGTVTFGIMLATDSQETTYL